MQGRNKKLVGVATVAIAALMLTAVLSMVPQGAEATTEFDGGVGTWEDPYVISTVEQLQAMNEDLEADYALGSFIDAMDTENWTDGFNPIGDKTAPFEGSLRGSADGPAFLIVGLYINSNEDNVGLFGYTGESAVIERIGLANAYINGGNDNTGGLVGWNSGGISESYVSGKVSGNGNVGGLVGTNNGTISDCYSLADITEGDTVGGLVGDVTAAGDVNRTYAAGEVGEGTTGTGGLIGESAGNVVNSFWDNMTTGQTESAGGEGENTAAMKAQSTFDDAGWDFENTWNITEGESYPRLANVFSFEQFEEFLQDLIEDMIGDICASVVLVPLIAGGLVVASRRK